MVSVVHALGMVHQFFDEPVAELGLDVKRVTTGCYEVFQRKKEKGQK